MNTPFIVLNSGSSVPPYEQINLQIRTLIASRQLEPGSPLPSVRQLARDLGVAPNTIVRAYNELEREGWITVSLRRGAIVATLLPVPAAEERQERLRAAVSQFLVTMHQLGVSAQELHAEIDRQLAESVSTAS